MRLWLYSFHFSAHKGADTGPAGGLMHFHTPAYFPVSPPCSTDCAGRTILFIAIIDQFVFRFSGLQDAFENNQRANGTVPFGHIIRPVK